MNMNIANKMNSILQFVKTDIWSVSRADVSQRRYFVYKIIKTLYLAIGAFTTKRVTNAAAALTYSTLLAMVPIVAVVFAISRGFGYSKYIETWFRDALSTQPQVAETIIRFVNSYLIHVKGGVILGFGLVLMLFTVLMLTSNIETTFNNIWQVKKQRSIFRTFTDYTTMLFMIPIIIVLTSGVSIFMATVNDSIKEYMLLGPMMRLCMKVTPYLIMSVIFIALYMFMPNTNVKFRSAWFPGILAGVAMQMLQFFYIHSQIWVSSYNAIYGSFAALPLFMLWVQISWSICLFGAELTYTNQNLEDYAFMSHTKDISHRHQLLLCALLLSIICKRFEEGRKPYTALDLKLKTNIPIRIINDLLYELSQARLVVEVSTDEKGAESVFQPAESLSNISVGVMIDRLEALGIWNLDINLRDNTSVNWGRVYAIRKKYLSDMREILLKDL